jgi:GntR family transcriptional regulator
MGLKADDSRPPYIQIADDLRESIRSGDLAPGDQLPTTRALEVTYGVANMTVQNALRTLRDENLTYSVQGRGSFVRSDVDPASLDTDNAPSSEYLEITAYLDDISRILNRLEQRVDELEQKQAKTIDIEDGKAPS